MAALKPPEKADHRDDVKAAQQQERAAAAMTSLGLAKNQPNLDVNALAQLNGRDPALGVSAGQSFGTRFPTWGIGVKFSAPLDFDTLSADRQAYARERQGAELQLRRTQFEEAQTWADLNERLGEARNRLSMAAQLEEAQRVKLGYEKERLSKGRSVTFQVLQFEQDFASAQLARIHIAYEILQILAQMKTSGATRRPSHESR